MRVRECVLMSESHIQRVRLDVSSAGHPAIGHGA